MRTQSMRTYSFYYNPKYMWVWIFIEILIGIAVLVAGFFILRYIFNLEKFTNKNEFTLEYFYMTGCPHCVSFEDTWKKITETKDLNVSFKKYNLSEEEGSKRGKIFGINSAPTVLITKNDKIVSTFEESRTYDNIIKFVKNTVK